MSQGILHAVLSNAAHPEYGAATIPFPIPREIRALGRDIRHIGRIADILGAVLSQGESLVHAKFETDYVADNYPTKKVTVRMFPCRLFFRLFSPLNLPF